MSYDPSTFNSEIATFFFMYNASAQGPLGTGDAVLNVDASAHGGWVMDTNHDIDLVSTETAVARADAIMTPNSSDEYNTFGYLRSDGNPSYGSGNPISAWQDHPARTSYHTSLTDEALLIEGTTNVNVKFAKTTANANFNVAVGRVVMGGFVR
jgi:hypothetical protein